MRDIHMSLHCSPRNRCKGARARAGGRAPTPQNQPNLWLWLGGTTLKRPTSYPVTTVRLAEEPGPGRVPDPATYSFFPALHL